MVRIMLSTERSEVKDAKMWKLPLQIVEFTSRKDQHVPHQSLYHPATFWSEVKVRDLKMRNSFLGVIQHMIQLPSVLLNTVLQSMSNWCCMAPLYWRYVMALYELYYYLTVFQLHGQVHMLCLALQIFLFWFILALAYNILVYDMNYCVDFFERHS